VHLLIALFLLAQHKPSVAMSAPAQPATETKAVLVVQKVRCASCPDGLEGTLAILADSVRFCCTSWVGAKAAAVCPYSFSVELKAVKDQYLATGEKRPSLHLVTSDSVDYVFIAASAQDMKSAFEKLQVVCPDIASKVMEQHGDALMKGMRAPKIVAGDVCP
jgi:hypothetical protein